LLQNVWEPNNKKNQEPLTKTDMEKLILEPKLALTDNYWERCIQTAWGVVMLPVTLIVFPKKFKQYFAYGNECINIDHPSVQIIIKLLLKYLVARFEGKLDKNQSTNMGSVIYSIIFSRPGVIGSQTYNQWANNFNELKYLLPEGLLLNKEEWKSLPPPESDFVPGSMDSFLGTKVKRNWAEPFGKIL
jgi:hypothetical protein